MTRPTSLLSLLASVVLAAAVAPSSASAACSYSTATVLPGTATSISASSCAVSGAPAIVTQPQHGSVSASYDQRTGIVGFYLHADSSYRGTDSFTWTGAADGPQTFTYTVEAPQLQCTVGSRPYNAPPPFTVRAGTELLVNVTCSNRGDEQLLGLELTTPAHGTATVVPDGGTLVFAYRAAAGYSGPDCLSVRVTSRLAGRSSAPIEVPLTVQAANRPPVCAPPAVPTVVLPDKAAFWSGICSDPDGDPLSYGIRHTPGTWGQLGWVTITGDQIGWAYSTNVTQRGPYTLPFVVGDGFSEVPFDIVVDLRDTLEGDKPPTTQPTPSNPNPPKPPRTPTLPAAPEGFVPARGVDLGSEVAVWGPVGGIRLGRRSLPIIAVGCRQACEVRAELFLLPKRRKPVALPARTLRLNAGKRAVATVRLTAAARNSVRGRKSVKALLVLQSGELRSELPLRVSLPPAKG